MTAHRAGNSRHRRPSCRLEIPIQRRGFGIRVLAGTGEARRAAIPARAAPDRGQCADLVHSTAPDPPSNPDRRVTLLEIAVWPGRAWSNLRGARPRSGITLI